MVARISISPIHLIILLPGASGIGKAVSATLKKLGANVVVGDLKKSDDAGIHSVLCDVTNIDQMQVCSLLLQRCHL
jgi:hypothetical protein